MSSFYPGSEPRAADPNRREPEVKEKKREKEWRELSWAEKAVVVVLSVLAVVGLCC